MAKIGVEGQMDLFEIFGSVEELEENVKGVPEFAEDEPKIELEVVEDVDKPVCKNQETTASVIISGQQAVMQKTFHNKVTKQTAVIAYLNYNKVYQKIWDEEPVIYQFEQSKDAVDYYVNQMAQFSEDKQIEVLKQQETLVDAIVIPWMKE